MLYELLKHYLPISWLKAVLRQLSTYTGTHTDPSSLDFVAGLFQFSDNQETDFTRNQIVNICE